MIDLLDADVIGLQEIADRAALELLFPPQAWHLVIDDDSTDAQDVALAVRKPISVVGLPPDLDADDQHFLFSSASNDLFPNRRDVLAVHVQMPDDPATFVVMVIHAKSRVGGRATTDARREDAARALIRVLERDFDDKDFILLGDFNDNPDDRSLNILETGDPNAPAGPEEIDGPFLMNVTEVPAARDQVSFGRTASRCGRGDHHGGPGQPCPQQPSAGKQYAYRGYSVRPNPDPGPDARTIRQPVGHDFEPCRSAAGHRHGRRLGSFAGVGHLCLWWRR